MKNEKIGLTKLAQHMGLNKYTLKSKLNKYSDFKIEELEKISTFFNNKYTIEEFLLDI